MKKKMTMYASLLMALTGRYHVRYNIPFSFVQFISALRCMEHYRPLRIPFIQHFRGASHLIGAWFGCLFPSGAVPVSGLNTMHVSLYIFIF